MHELKFIDLSYNLLTSIGANLFTNLQLNELHLEFNRLTTLPATLIKPYISGWTVDYINLANNRLNAMYNTTFNSVTLKTLNLLNNVCINAAFNKTEDLNVNTAVMKALAKCDANARIQNL
jgi:Leucine-rich repeat (LRR) protein